MSTPCKIGLFGIGLDTYWPQFHGLLERLTGYQREIGERLKSYGVELVDAGMVDTPEKAHEAAGLFRRQEVDLIFLLLAFLLYRTMFQPGNVQPGIFPSRASL